MSAAFVIALIACFLPFVFVLVDYSFQKTYVTHSSGVVVITGASTGIGRHAAEYLANTTDYIVLVGVRKVEDAKAITDLNNK